MELEHAIVYADVTVGRFEVTQLLNERSQSGWRLISVTPSQVTRDSPASLSYEVTGMWFIFARPYEYK